MLLVDYLHAVYFVERELESNTRYLIALKVKVFREWLGREAKLSDLTPETVNQFVLHRLEVRSRETVRGERSILRGIWAHAFERGDTEVPPMRLRKVRRGVQPPDAWDENQLRSLLAIAAIQPGRFEKFDILRADYWSAFILTAYDTALRLGDLLALECRKIRGPGSLTVIQHKTRKPLDVVISERAWGEVKKIRSSKRPYLFGGVICRRHFFPSFARLVRAAGLEGGTKMLRRSAGSLFERDNPGEGQKLLGNGRDVFERHYLNQQIIKRPGRLPPRLDSA
jgi:integrase